MSCQDLQPPHPDSDGSSENIPGTKLSNLVMRRTEPEIWNLTHQNVLEESQRLDPRSDRSGADTTPGSQSQARSTGARASQPLRVSSQRDWKEQKALTSSPAANGVARRVDRWTSDTRRIQSCNRVKRGRLGGKETTDSKKGEEKDGEKRLHDQRHLQQSIDGKSLLHAIGAQ